MRCRSPGSLKLAALPLSLATLVLTVGCGGSEPGPGADSPAAIESFVASPSTLEGPGTTELSWQTSNAATLVLLQDGVEVELGDASHDAGSVEVPLETTASFELIATGASGDSVSRRLTVEVTSLPPPPEPSIATFTGPDVIELDELGAGTAILSWTGVAETDALRLEAEPGEARTLEPGSIPDGSLEVTVTAETIFTLVATNDHGEARESVTVRVAPLPRIDDFSVDRTWVGFGQFVQASWATTGVTDVQLWLNGQRLFLEDPGLGTGSLPIQILIDSTLELRATNELGTQVTSSLELEVGPPAVTSFAGSGSSLWLGEAVEITWTSEGGTEALVSVDGVEEPICASTDFAIIDGSSCSWTPPAAGSYQLTLAVSNLSGVASDVWAVSVGVGPTLTSFSAAPEAITLGESVTLRWAALPDPSFESPALVVEDDRGGSYELAEQEGSLSITPPSGLGIHVLTLTATTTDPRSVPAVATAQILIHGFPTATLVATPGTFDETESESVKLEWTSEHAASLALYRLDGAERIEVVAIPEQERAAGSYEFVPQEPAATYLLVAQNALGVEVTAQAEVRRAPPEVVRFTADVTEVVAGQPVLLSWETKMGDDLSLDIFHSGYVAEEIEAPFIDVTTLGGTHLPLTNLCGVATILTNGCARLSLEQDFSFGGTSRQEAIVYGFGLIGFGPAPTINDTVSLSISNQILPTAAGVKDFAHLAPFWDNLTWDPAQHPTGNIHYLRRTDPVLGNSLIVQWKGAQIVNNPGISLDFEVILWESGAFEYRYGSMSPGRTPTEGQVALAEGASATIGFQTPSQGAYHNRGYNWTPRVPGSLVGRAFTYQPAPALTKSGSYLWHPYAPGENAVATLRTSHGQGEDLRFDEETISIRVHQKPQVRVSGPADPILTGATFRVSWVTEGATALEVLDSTGAVRCTAQDAAATRESFCNLSESTEGVHVYRVRVEGPLDSTVERRVQAVVYQPFSIASFSSDLPVVDMNGEVVLNWNTVNAAQVSLKANGVELLPGGAPTGPGTRTVSGLNQNTTFVLRITNALGMVRESSVFVEVQSVRLSITADRTSVRPGEPISLTVNAVDLAGGGAPTIWGTVPMKDVSSTSSFVDISGHPNAVNLTRNWADPNLMTDGSAQVFFPTGFDFPYYGTLHSSLRVFVDGFISFNALAPSISSNRFLPDRSISNYANVHLAPFWDDFTLRTSSAIWAAQIDDDTFIVQWRGSLEQGSDFSRFYELNFQVVLYRSGAFEYRYGEMLPPPGTSAACSPDTCVNEANGSSATIGYQMPDSLSGFTLHNGGAFPGGLASRAFRYEPAVSTQVVTIQPSRSGTYTYCSRTGSIRVCESIEVQANFGLDSFTAGSNRIELGESTTLNWMTRGGTSLQIVDNFGVIVHSTTDPAQIDAGSITITPVDHRTYTLILTAYWNRATRSTTVEVSRIAFTVTAPASVHPGDDFEISWTLTNSAPSMTPTVIKPMEEVFDRTFAALDLAADPDAVELIGGGNHFASRKLVFESGFTFDYLGQVQTQVTVASDGWLSFAATTPTNPANVPIPSTAQRAVHIAPFWDNLNTMTNGRVLAKLVDPDRYVIQWSRTSLDIGSILNVEHDLNFMVVLHRNGDFEFRYGDMLPPPGGFGLCATGTCWEEANGAYATIGYQDPLGKVAYAIQNDTPFIYKPAVLPHLGNRSWIFTKTSTGGKVTTKHWDTKTYEICAIFPTGDSFCSHPVTVEMRWGMTSFNASATTIGRGTPVTLDWSVFGLDALTVLENGIEILNQYRPVPETGSLVVNPTDNSVYELVGDSLGRKLSRTISIEVKTLDMDLTQVTGRLFPGSPVNLSWDITAYEPGALGVLVPLYELPSGPGEAGAFEDISLLVGPNPTDAKDITSSFSSNNGSAWVDLPFDFPYFQDEFDYVRIFVDGFLTFEPTITFSGGVNGVLPSSTRSKLVQLAPFWDNFILRGTPTVGQPYDGPEKIVTYQKDADTFIVQWTHMNLSYFWEPDTPFDLNFQAVLHSNGNVDFRYGALNHPAEPYSWAGCSPNNCSREARGATATIAVQDPNATVAHLFHNGGNSASSYVDFPGGLEGRGFRYAPSPTGSLTTVVGASPQDLEICALLGIYHECQSFHLQPVAAPGDFMITEVMVDPSGGPGSEWFEVRNLTERTIDLEGFTIATDRGSFVIPSKTEVAPGEFAVFASSLASGTTPAAAWGAAVPFDKQVDTLRLMAGTSTIASVHWDAGWNIPTGHTLSLDSSYHWVGVTSNDTFGRWCPDSLGSPGTLGRGCRSPHYDVDPNGVGSWIDLSAIGVKVPEFDGPADQVVSIPTPGFDWPFFSGTVSQVWIGANGFISFAAAKPGGGTFAPTVLPRGGTAEPRGPLIAGFWQQLRCTSTIYDCDFHYYWGDVGGQDVLVAQWRGFRPSAYPGSSNFQIQLWENGDVRIVFGEVEALPGSSTSNWNAYKGLNSWTGIEAATPATYVSALLRQQADLNNRVIHFIRK